jgi:hypothetical protein
MTSIKKIDANEGPYGGRDAVIDHSWECGALAWRPGHGT